MSGHVESPRRIRRRSVSAALAAAGVASLLVTQPTLDLVARHPAFLDVHRLGAPGIVVLAVLSTLIPAVLAAPLGLWLARRRPLPTPVRRWLTLLSVSLLVVPALFLLQPGVRSRLAQPEPEPGAVVEKPAPIVFLVLDELPLKALLDEQDRLDRSRFPGFERLAAMSHWFAGARSPYATTLPAVPALVTGRYADDDLVVPDADECNLFTDLAAAYALDVEERVTRLARGIRRPGLVRATWCSPPSSSMTIARDLVVLYLHRMLPAAWTGSLPEVDGAWGAFGRGLHASDSAADPRVADFEEFIVRLRSPGEAPELWFFHADLPHQPWTLGEPRGTLVAQLRVVDELVGDLLDRMDRLGLLEPSLLVVVADHGIGLSAGAGERGDPDRRVVFDEILRVPLFLKLPGQTDGARHDAYVETVDVVPTLAEVLGYGPVCPPDGRSLFGPARSWQETTFSRHREWSEPPVDRARPAGPASR